MAATLLSALGKRQDYSQLANILQPTYALVLTAITYAKSNIKIYLFTLALIGWTVPKVTCRPGEFWANQTGCISLVPGPGQFRVSGLNSLSHYMGA